MRWIFERETRKKYSYLDRNDVDEIVTTRARASFFQKRPLEDYNALLKRLRQSCYLDDSNVPLDAEQRLLEQYGRDGLVLFLGAGVSVGSNVPNWESLIQSLIRKAAMPPSDNIDFNRSRVEHLLREFDRVYIHLGSKQKEFLKLLYDCLYEHFDAKLRVLLGKIPLRREALLGWKHWDECCDALAQNRSLAAVGDLLVTDDPVIQGRAPWRRNPQVHAVLTVNADNLLELYCQAKTRGHRVIAQVDRASVGDHPDAIPVCHLHGTLDIRGENFKRLSRMDRDLLPDVVFRTPEYRRTIASPSSFVNLTPQSYRRNLTLVLILTNTLENQGFPAGASLPFQLRSPISGGDGTPPWTMPDSRR